MIVNKKLASFVCFALVVLVSLAAVAADDTGITLTRDGRTAIATKPSTDITPAQHPAKVTTIAGNLSDYPFGVFFCCYGNTIAGISSALGFEVWAAIPFTPTADFKVTELEASVGYIESADTNFLLSLYGDTSGLPGKVIKSFATSATTVFGDCCTLATAKSSTGVPVTKGTQYWLVVSTNDKKHPTFFGAWAFNSTDMREHPIAYWCKTTGNQCGSNNGKWTASTNLLPGYAVLGE